MKMLMAVSGALFVFYVLVHMYGNLKIFGGVDAFNEYADHLRTLFTPDPAVRRLPLALPGRPRRRARRARVRRVLPVGPGQRRPHRRATWPRPLPGATVTSKMMRWGGVALLLFLVWHLLQFTIVKFNVGIDCRPKDSPGLLVISSFQVWWVVLIYLLALVASGLHLYHGVWSATQTLGWAGNADRAPARQDARRWSSRSSRAWASPSRRSPSSSDSSREADL